MNKKLNNRYTTKKRKSSNKKRTLRNKTKLGKQQRKQRVVQIGGISDGEKVHLIKTTLDDTELLNSDGTVNESKQTQKVREIIDIIKHPPDQSKSTEPKVVSTFSKSAESVLREPLLNSHNGSEATPQIHTEDQKKLTPAKQTVLYAACNLKIPSLGIVRELLKLDEIKINRNSYNPGAWPQHGAVLAAIDILNDDTISAKNKYRRLLVILDILKMLKSKSEGGIGIFQQKKYNRADYGNLPLMAQRYDLSRHNSDYEPNGATALDEFDKKLKPLISDKLSRYSDSGIIQEFTDVLDYTPKYTGPR